QLPQHRHYSWHTPYPLDYQAMREAASHFIGKHDFTAFCNIRKNADYDSYVRHVTSIEIEELAPERLRIKIRGNNFLYKMVRNIVGTLVYIGRGKIHLSELAGI